MAGRSETVLVVPGLRGSGLGHWQSWFESSVPGSVRVQQTDWNTPDLSRWSAALQAAVEDARRPTWVVAHSFGCLATAHLVPRCRDRIAGVMLVAPADPDKFGISGVLPLEPFDLPSVVVASTNDPWMGFLRAAWLAERWGSRLINLGPAGHINQDAGFGAWPQGLEIFENLREAAEGLPEGVIEESARRTVPQRARGL